jgi:hypothetical protein
LLQIINVKPLFVTTFSLVLKRVSFCKFMWGRMMLHIRLCGSNSGNYTRKNQGRRIYVELEMFITFFNNYSVLGFENSQFEGIIR